MTTTSDAPAPEANAPAQPTPAHDSPSGGSAEAPPPAEGGGAAVETSAGGEGALETERSEAHGAEGPEGPEGPSLSEDAKKKKRRRGKKGGAAAAGPTGPGGPEGPPVEGAEGARAAKSRPPPRDRAAAFTPGEEVFGKVTALLEHAIMVDLAGKALAIFDRAELASDDLVPEVGDRFVAHVLGDGGRGGLVVISRKLLREEESKPLVEKAFQEKATVEGLVTGVIRGGLEVYLDGLRAFAPASHVDLRPGADLNHLIGQRLTFNVEQYAKRGRDVVVSRKSMLEGEARGRRESSLAKLTPGAVVKGVVRSVVQWGAFVAIPEADNIEGLVHVSEISHDPRAHLGDVVKVGDEIDVKISRIDEKGKLWLSKKAAEPDPWESLRTKYALGSRHKGTVSRIQPFGVFVSLEPGFDGLIPTADLSVRRFERPEDVVKEGQELEVVVASFDAATKKLSLHPAPPEAEAGLRQKVVPHKAVKVAIVTADLKGLTVRILGASGRHARGFVPAGLTGTPRGTDLRKHFPVGSQHEVKVIEVDPRRGEAKLSVKAMREDTEKAAYNEYRAGVAKEAKFGTFGDLLKKAQQNQGS